MTASYDLTIKTDLIFEIDHVRHQIKKNSTAQSAFFRRSVEFKVQADDYKLLDEYFYGVDMDLRERLAQLVTDLGEHCYEVACESRGESVGTLIAE